MSDESPIPNGSPVHSQSMPRPEELYDDLSRRATEQIERLREMKVGEAIDQVTELLKRYPMAGLATAALAGFILGRALRQ